MDKRICCGLAWHERIAYVAGPYRSETISGIQHNIERARAVAEELWQMGFAVFCPHANSANMDGVVPDWMFLAADLEFIARFDLVVMMPNWEQSSGAQGERAHALALGRPVFYWPEDEDRLREIGGSLKTIREFRG